MGQILAAPLVLRFHDAHPFSRMLASCSGHGVLGYGYVLPFSCIDTTHECMILQDKIGIVSEALYPMIHRFLPVLYQAQHLVEHWESIGASFLLPDNCSLACICASAGCNDISEASHGAPEQGTTEVEGWLWRDPYCRFGQYSSFFAILCLSAGRVAVQNCMIACTHEVKRDKRAQ